MAKYKDFILFDNTTPVSVEEMLEYCQKCGIDSNKMDMYERIDLINMMEQGLVDDFYTTIQEMSISDDDFVVNGTLDLWYGKEELKAKVINGLFEAIISCATTGKAFCATYVGSDGSIKVDVSHSYGSRSVNSFTIRALSSKGKEFIKKLADNGRMTFDFNDSKMYMFKKIKPSELNHDDIQNKPEVDRGDHPTQLL